MTNEVGLGPEEPEDPEAARHPHQRLYQTVAGSSVGLQHLCFRDIAPQRQPNSGTATTDDFRWSLESPHAMK